MAENPEEFKHTHYYNPIGWDHIDPKPHFGSSVIKRGAPIQRIGNVGPGKAAGKLAFVHVRDEAGNNQSVARGSLQSKKKYAEEQRGASAPPGERLGYTDFHKDLERQSEDVHKQYFNDRRSGPDLYRQTAGNVARSKTVGMT